MESRNVSFFETIFSCNPGIQHLTMSNKLMSLYKMITRVMKVKTKMWGQREGAKDKERRNPMGQNF